MRDLRLIIWDVDGTLTNSRAAILSAMQGAFAQCNLPYPGDAAALEGVGLSLDILLERLVPDTGVETREALARAYKQTYYDQRARQGAAALAPLFPGIRAVLDHLRAQEWTLMSAATGKSRRGLEAMIAGHALDGYFYAPQTADTHPSKPHPSMIESILAQSGVEAERAIMIGDTTFDMEMGAAAGVRTLGVGWGYHAAERLEADAVATSVEDLPRLIDATLGENG